MKMLTSLVIAVLLVWAPRLASSFDDDFADFDDDVDFAERVHQLKQLSATQGLVHLSYFHFQEWVAWSARNYSFLLLFVATTSELQCVFCGPALEEFAILGQSVRRSASLQDRLFLGVVDYPDGAEIFGRMGVQMVPSVVFVPAGRQPTPSQVIRMDVERRGYSAEAMSGWLAAAANVPVEIVRPPDYWKAYGLLGFVVLAGVLAAAAWKWGAFAPSRAIAELGVVVFCALMVSGHMFNRIRQTPPYQRSGQSLILVSRVSNNQYAYETFLVCGLHLGFSGCVIAVVGKTGPRHARKGMVVAAATIMATLFYTCIVSLFRYKVDDYPYGGLVNLESYF